MGKRRLPTKEASAGDRLRRVAEQPERFGNVAEIPIENLIVIGASAGGYIALKEVIRGLSQEIPAAVIILQHMGSVPRDEWVNALAEHTVVPTAVAKSGDRLQRARIYVTPPGHSPFLEGRTLQLEPQTKGPPVTTINRLFESAATEYRDRVIGVILTGLLKDGTAGLKAVHDAGGLTIVQDPAEAEYPDMPANAMQDLPVTFCLKLAEIGPSLDVLARRKTELETGLALSVRMIKDRVALLIRLMDQSKHNPGTFQFLSAELTALRAALASLQGQLDVS